MSLYLRLINCLVLCLVSVTVAASEKTAAMVRDAQLDSTSVALKIVRLSDNAVIESYNSDSPLIPASIMKCITTASLVTEEGADFRFHTKVYLEGKVHDGALRGNLLIVGSGDPTLNSRREPASGNIIKEITDAVVKHGIDRIEGRIVVNEDVYTQPACPPTWAKGDLPHSYGTGCHGLNFEDNSRGKSSVANPSAVFMSQLEASLRAAGVAIGSESMPAGERSLLFDHVSAPADEIMRSCMMRSDNLFAESLLRKFALETSGKGDTESGAAKEMKLWKSRKVPMSGVEIIDGSGLSRSNRVTADFMSGVLAKMSGNPVYASFFPLAGQEGTLKNFCCGTPLDSYLALKTGSMSGIQCYAGYMLDDDYVPTHTVVVIINNMKTGRQKVREELKNLLLSVFCQNSDND